MNGFHNSLKIFFLLCFSLGIWGQTPQEVQKRQAREDHLVAYFNQHQTWQNGQSNPKATHTIYLNFCGDNLQNVSPNRPPLVAPLPFFPPYNSDNHPDTFSDQECAEILLAAKMTAENYAPFDVNFTIRRPDTTTGKNYMALIGEVGNGRTGGQSQLNTFGSAIPAYVYQLKLPQGQDSLLFLGLSISHELGHTLGLNHDYTQAVFEQMRHRYEPQIRQMAIQRRIPAEQLDRFIEFQITKYAYFTGNETWGAIMGNPAKAEICHWANQHSFPGSQNTEDDIAIIAQHLGFRPTPNEQAKSALSIQLNGKPITGVIRHQKDALFYTLKIPQTTRCQLHLSLDPTFGVPNLHPKVSLYRKNKPNPPSRSFMILRIDRSKPTLSSKKVAICSKFKVWENLVSIPPMAALGPIRSMLPPANRKRTS